MVYTVAIIATKAKKATITSFKENMHIQNLDLNRLQIFRAIVLAGSMSKAALQLGQPKSRISRQLSALESEIGSQLIIRSTRQWRLTQAGQSLLQNVVPLLNELEMTIERLSTNEEAVTGKIRITVPDDIATEMMGTICHSFSMLYPDVSLEIYSSNEMVDLLKNSFDLGIRIGTLRDSSLIQKKICDISLGLYTSPEMRGKYGTPSKLSELSLRPFLAYSSSALARQKSLRLSVQGSFESIAIKTIFASNSFFILRDMAVKGVGFTMLPNFVAKKAVENGHLVSAMPEATLESKTVQVVFPNQKDIPIRIRKFIEHLKNQLPLFI